MSDYKFKFMDVPDYKDPSEKKSSFKLMLVLTLVIIGLIFAIFTRGDVKDQIQTTVANRAAEQQFGSSDQGTGTQFDRLNHVTDRESLAVQAEQEAQRMLQSGDVSEYEKALSNHRVLRSIAK